MNVFHHRPTEQTHFWPPENEVLAGKDLQAGGTWLGINKRGELVLKTLGSQAPITSSWLREHSSHYNPFNLIFGDVRDRHRLRVGKTSLIYLY